MKRNLLVAIILTLLSAPAFCQPVVIFQTSHFAIKYTTDGTTLTNVPSGNPDNIPGYGKVNIALYSAPAGTVLTSSGGSPAGVPDLSGPWMIQTSPLIQNIAPLPGTVAASIIVILDAGSGAPGADVEMEAVYWTGNYTSFAQALDSGNSLVAWSGSAASGGAFGWEQATGPAMSAPLINMGATAFNGLVNSIPEPPTLALGGLGAVALLLFRRPKQQP